MRTNGRRTFQLGFLSQELMRCNRDKEVSFAHFSWPGCRQQLSKKGIRDLDVRNAGLSMEL